ncbi:MAG: hypothetical protein HUK40_06155 [Desulfobacter sp.]|nr:hypothetical protein [Desulfobacter sp.]
MIIYVVDAHRKQRKKLSSFIDGCFNGPGWCIPLVKGLFELPSYSELRQILFVADGAHWKVWNKIPGLLKALGLAPERVYELLDFYHAVEHLGTVAGLREDLVIRERKRWVSKAARSSAEGKGD